MRRDRPVGGSSRTLDAEEDRMHHPFRVGAVYRNRQGPYKVMSIEGPVMTLRYTDGKVV